MTDLKLRRKRPRTVIDLQSVEGLSAIDVGDGIARIGAMARQADIVQREDVAEQFPLLVEIASAAADPMVRRRGTLVGALCAVEPGGDWLCGCLAMDGIVEIAGAVGKRDVPLTEFIHGARVTTLGRDEIAVAVRLRAAPRGARSAYRKVKHIAIGWSIASVAAVLDIDDGGRCKSARVAVSGAPHGRSAFRHWRPRLAYWICAGAITCAMRLPQACRASVLGRLLRVGWLSRRTSGDAGGAALSNSRDERGKAVLSIQKSGETT